VVVVLFLTFLVSARLIIPSHAIIPYAYPITATGLTIASLFGVEIAVVTFAALHLDAYGCQFPGADALLHNQHAVRSAGAWASPPIGELCVPGLAVGVSGSIIVLVYRYPMPTTDLIGLGTLTAAAFFKVWPLQASPSCCMPRWRTFWGWSPRCSWWI